MTVILISNSSVLNSGSPRKREMRMVQNVVHCLHCEVWFGEGVMIQNMEFKKWSQQLQFLLSTETRTGAEWGLPLLTSASKFSIRFPCGYASNRYGSRFYSRDKCTFGTIYMYLVCCVSHPHAISMHTES